ncbi:MAG: hypothetical protein IT577_02560 [Verrucomicrobiae bacterium]|nr:hypothetical protein [Verrucomicrobiae bacterium]
MGGALIVALAIALGANYLSGAIHAIWNWSAGPERPAPYALLQLHGISAVALQVLAGALIVAHILPAWSARRHIASGLALAIPLAVLVATGLGLYYAGNESLRAVCLWSHTAVGLVLPLPLIIHILWRKG